MENGSRLELVIWLQRQNPMPRISTFLEVDPQSYQTRLGLPELNTQRDRRKSMKKVFAFYAQESWKLDTTI